MSRIHFASGIFTWWGEERRTDRYGSFVLENKNHNGDASSQIILNKEYKDFVDKKVKITAIVKENRESGHLGDVFLNITPSKPEVNEEIVLGIGCFKTEDCSWSENKLQFVLFPDDGRSVFWFNPEILYRLHDQTVDMYIEETEEAFSTPYSNNESKEEGFLNEDNSFQVKTHKDKINIQPKMERIEDGLFVVSFPKKTKYNIS